MSETPEKELQAEAPTGETQFDKQPAVLKRRSGRMRAIVLSLSALVLVGAAAAAYAFPINTALVHLSNLASLFPHETVSAPIPDPVSAALKDLQSVQQQNSAALQENGAALQRDAAMLQQDAATLETLRQAFTAQQTELKRISNQLSSLVTRIDTLQNAVTPLMTSSMPHPRGRGRQAPQKTTSRLSKPVGPVSIGGAPLGPAS